MHPKYHRKDKVDNSVRYSMINFSPKSNMFFLIAKSFSEIIKITSTVQLLKKNMHTTSQEKR